MADNTISVRTFAMLADITLHYAYDLLWSGKVDCTQAESGKWLVDERSAQEYARKRRARRQRQQDRQGRKAARRAEQQRRTEEFQTLRAGR
jgi:hypothetical protein